MTLLQERVEEIFVKDARGIVHRADVSNIMKDAVDRESIYLALDIYFRKHHLVRLSADELSKHFPPRNQRLDRRVSLPVPRSKLQRNVR